MHAAHTSPLTRRPPPHTGADIASWPLPITCFSPWPNNFAVLPASIAPHHYAPAEPGPADAAAPREAHRSARSSDAALDAGPGVLPAAGAGIVPPAGGVDGALAVLQEAVATAHAAHRAASAARLAAHTRAGGAVAPQTVPCKVPPSLRGPCMALGTEIGKAAAAAAAKGCSGSSLQAAWLAALRALGSRAAAEELPAAVEAGIGAAGRAFFGGGAAVAKVAGSARALVLLSLVGAVGEAADGPWMAAEAEAAPHWRHGLAVGEAVELVCGLAPALGGQLPLAMASALAGHLTVAPGGDVPATAAAAAARVWVECAVHAPLAGNADLPPVLPPPPPRAEALGAAMAGLALQINGRVATPEAHAAIQTIGRGLAVARDEDGAPVGPAALGAALAALPAAAARVGRRGWPCWGPLLAALCAAGMPGPGGQAGAAAGYASPMPAPPQAGAGGAVFMEPSNLLDSMAAASRGLLSEVMAPGPGRAAAAARGRAAALAAAALLSWLQESASSGAEGVYSLLPARRNLAQVSASLAAAAGAPASVVDALEQQWQLGLPGLAGARALAGGHLLAHLDHAAFLDLDAVSAELPPPPVLFTSAPLRAAVGAVRAVPLEARDSQASVPSPPATPQVRTPGCTVASPAPPPPAPPLLHGVPSAKAWHGAVEGSGAAASGAAAGAAAQLDAEEAAAERRAAEMEAEAALEDLTDEVCGTADRLCRRLATDAALLGHWGPGKWAPAALHGGAGAFASASELLLHLRALVRTAPTADDARRRLLPLRQGLLHLERLAARLPCPAGGWFASTSSNGSQGMIWTLHEALWDAGKGSPVPVPPPPPRLLALVLGLLPTERAPSAAVQARLAAAAEASGLAAAADVGEADDFPPELLVAPSAETWWRGVLGAGAGAVLED
jgi:hypothetical protein